MSLPILTLAIEREADVVVARQRARRIAELLGFAIQDQTRIATAVSEIARNAHGYAAHGRVEFAVEGAHPQSLRIRIRDRGPGIRDLESILAGRYRSSTGLGLGLRGSRSLVEDFSVETDDDGTVVTLSKVLPGRGPVGPAQLGELARALSAETPGDPLSEFRAQNQELLHSLDELAAREAETARLNAELEETNRGVVALYAELDGKAVELETLNSGLKARVAAAIAEREIAEESLRQSQKMEAVGQLTGGIAHDFNNLLQIISGNLEILLRNLPNDPPRLRRAAGHAMMGAERAASLTHRLLAFSRRQPLAPKVLDANLLVTGMTDLLRRTLGEHIRIETVLADGLWRVKVDPNQLENALVNLAVNARDAMPDGGVLTVETCNTELDDEDAARHAEVRPGAYVALCVTDTGGGIHPEVLARVFEPFFTTKDIGKGTGLGLSMVYGFIKQSDGHVKIDSEIGAGATVQLYLPRWLDPSAGVS